jgi:hypothetical protein
MQESVDSLLRIYQRALSQLGSLDRGIEEQLKRIVTAALEGGLPTARDLALLEGLRSERDQARGSLRDAEQTIFNNLLAQLGVSSDPAK